MEIRSTLQQMMSNNADIVLAFSKDNVKETLKSHSSIIRFSSPVLAHALDLQSTGSNRHDSSCSSSCSSSSTLAKLPLPGTSKADFLVVGQFLYPVLPLPKVSWDILEVLLVEGRKWDMQVGPALTTIVLRQLRQWDCWWLPGRLGI
jgi:hypothetical protein